MWSRVTNDEHPATYEHLEYSRKFCERHGIEHTHITPEMGHHPATWPGLREQYRRNTTVGSKRFRKSCTDNLKLKPIYNYLEQWVGRKYNLPTGRKEALKLFAKKYGKIRVLIGLAKGEESRCADPGKDPEKWRQCSVQIVYPLIEIGMDRAASQRYVRQQKEPVPPPSNCMLCPFMNEQELVWLFKNHPADYYDWVEIEAAKLEKDKALGSRNIGVFGPQPLPVVLEKALEKYGHWSKEKLDEFKFSHGHCVASKY